MELFGDSSELGETSQSMIYWFGTLAAVLNKIKINEKTKSQKFFDKYKKNEIPIEIITEFLSKIFNGALKIAIDDNSKATPDLTLGKYILLHYNKLLGQKIALRAKHRPILILELTNIGDNGIQVYETNKKDARKKPTIETDLEFERKLILGEDIDLFLSLINSKEFGTFSILSYMRYWLDLIVDFSQFIFIITVSFLHRQYLMEKLQKFVKDEIKLLFNKVDNMIIDSQ
ncbi:MAG: hypothetical protein ACTSQO_00715 [Candidatus Helarchaeota archaeon]